MEKTFQCRVLTNQEFGPVPELVRFTLTRDSAREILALAALARDHRLSRVEREDQRAQFLMEPDENSSEEYLVRVDGKVLRVTEYDFSFAAYIRYTQITVSSEAISVDELAQIFQL